VGRGARMGQERQVGPWWGKPEGTYEKRHKGDDKIEMDTKKYKALAWTGLICARIRTSGVSCK